MQPIIHIFLFIFFSLAHNVLSVNYCNTPCPDGSPHVGCNIIRPGSSKCPNFQLWHPLPPAIKNLIMNIHNVRRSRVASGNETNRFQERLHSASNMQELFWSEVFSELSSFNVMQCELKHDNCRSTDEFPTAGQNLGIFKTNGRGDKYQMTIDAVKHLIEGWYSEKKDVPNSMLRKFEPIHDDIQREHFTQMVWAKAVQIGCAIATFGTIGKDFTVLLCCDYSDGNVLGEAVYEFGPPRSRCPGGRVSRYGALCGESSGGGVKPQNGTDDGPSSGQEGDKGCRCEEDAKNSGQDDGKNRGKCDQSGQTGSLQIFFEAYDSIVEMIMDILERFSS